MDNRNTVYGIYWVPARHTRLGKFGAAWSGWCADDGAPCPQAEDSIADVLASNAASPEIRRSGLHAAVKSLFHLARDRTVYALRDALQATADETMRIKVGGVRLALCAGRLALIPGEQAAPAIAQLVARVARTAERFDAARPGSTGFLRGVPGFAEPVASIESAYPPVPVCEGTGFHLPLSGVMHPDRAARKADELAPQLAWVNADPLEITDIALVSLSAPGRPITIVERFRLARPGLRSGALGCAGRHVLAPVLGTACPAVAEEAPV
ncbi:MAG: DUF1045 domain-containing protein [Pseudomonadota bacterium]